MAEFRLRQYVSHIDYYVIFLSLHLLTEKSLFGCIVTFFTVILKRNIACIVHIVYIYEGIFKLSVGCVTFQEKSKSHFQRRNLPLSRMLFLLH